MNRDCKKIEEYLVDYLYQELPAKKTLLVEKHLRGCKSCAQTLESWTAIHRAYQRTTEEPQIAPYTKQKVLAAAQEELLRSPSWKERVLWGLKLATVPIAIFVIVLFLNSNRELNVAMTKPTPAAPTQVMRDERMPVDSEPQRAPATVGDKKLRERREMTDTELKRKGDEPADLDVISSRREQESLQKDQNKALKSLGYVAGNEAPAPSAPPPTPDESRYDAAAEGNRENAQIALEEPPVAQKAAAVSNVNKAEQPFEEAQKQFRSKNVKEGQNLLRQAISYDDERALAGKLHEQGSSYQTQGEYGLAIAQYENVQNNYKDYARMDDVLLRLGDSYAEIGEFNKAVNAYNQVSPAQRKQAIDRIQRLSKKREAQRQLESLGYTQPKKDQ